MISVTKKQTSLALVVVAFATIMIAGTIRIFRQRLCMERKSTSTTLTTLTTSTTLATSITTVKNLTLTKA